MKKFLVYVNLICIGWLLAWMYQEGITPAPLLIMAINILAVWSNS